LALLGGCASMSDKECLVVNWQNKGFRDGRLGFPLSRVVDHRDACASVGVVPNLDRYRRGHAQGIREYCTPANAVEEGRAGKPYRNACPPQLEDEFLYFYEQGRRVYDAQKEVERLNRESKRLERQLDKADSRRERRHLRRELRDLDERLRRARDTVADEERLLNYRRY